MFTSCFGRGLVRALTVLGFIAFSLGGCGILQQQMPGTLTPHRGARLIPPPDLSTGQAQQITTYYNQSFAECMRFKEALLTATSGVNASADLTALLLNALGTVITPVASVHLLASGAAAAIGAKTTFANDVTSTNTINLTIAFDKIYFQPMAALAEGVLSQGITTDAAPGLVSRIASLQAQCSLDEARAYIAQNLAQSVAQGPTGQPLMVMPAAAR